MHCYHCGSTQTHKHGKTCSGKQSYQCGGRGRSIRENPDVLGYTEAEKAQILRAYQERTSLRGLTRIFGVSRNTVSAELKKAQNLPPLEANSFSQTMAGIATRYAKNSTSFLAAVHIRYLVLWLKISLQYLG